ncbi:DUF305 domain-containing protein [Actinomycetospora sp. NBRC 106378]|uniref:DUF305 domain-containing protein n=1 Tax=Actinomycetospora sp. NBRC 106378 TaxID=3032208 RepID=UPI0024A5220A|nr:DUF305 domain-containing protein [Actinomycetospora sp. NBRC 106378]GLZ51942.1 hypothetical protein Acsp07_15590 [Actinomycetospora sp. NBRC 106378]
MFRALLVLLAFLTAGCAATPTATPAPAADDAGFATMMIPHHEQALDLSALVAGRTTDPTVTDLAFRIDREQVEEVGQLQGFLNLRGAPTPAPTGAMAGMAGMADAATLDRLRAASGPAFDRLWLQTMTAHHEGALTMARDYLAGPPGALSEFARTLLRTQQIEIDRMRAALGPV